MELCRTNCSRLFRSQLPRTSLTVLQTHGFGNGREPSLPWQRHCLRIKLMFLRPGNRSRQMILVMMAGMISACPMTCSIPVARQQSTVSGLTWPQKHSRAPSSGSKRTPPIVAIPFSKAPSIKMSTGISPRSRFTRRGAATHRNRTHHSRAEHVSSSSLASQPCPEAWFERARHALAPHRPKMCEADRAT